MQSAKRMVQSARFYKYPRYRTFRHIILFIFITVSIHVCYRFWMIDLHYYPIGNLFTGRHTFMEDVVARQSNWLLVNILHINTTLQDKTLYFPNKWTLIIGEGCSGVKQIIQVSILLLVYPGPWKHKAWFIPFSMLIIHFTNVFRLTLLGISINLNLPGIHFIHNQILRVFFYLVIFGLWLLWEEKFVKRDFKKIQLVPHQI
jgi:exosortase/archaeosortase family protein